MLLFLLYLLNFSYINCSKYVDKKYVVHNKTVLVTGGAQGTGYAIADNFLYEGATCVIIVDINVSKGKQAVIKLNTKYGDDKAKFLECDVTKDCREIFNKILTEVADIDILVNNAGFLNEFHVERTIDTMALATIQWSLEFREHMRKDKCGRGGTIINVASIMGHSVGPFMAVYKSAKYAVIGFSKTLGHEYNYDKTGIRVVTLCPAVTNTRLLKTARVWDEHQELFDGYLSKAPHQSPDAVGKGALQVYKMAKTGTVWDIIGGKEPMIAPASSTLIY